MSEEKKCFTPRSFCLSKFPPLSSPWLSSVQEPPATVMGSQWAAGSFFGLSLSLLAAGWVWRIIWFFTSFYYFHEKCFPRSGDESSLVDSFALLDIIYILRGRAWGKTFFSWVRRYECFRGLTMPKYHNHGWGEQEDWSSVSVTPSFCQHQ